jgi:hypothetical protein
VQVVPEEVGALHAAVAVENSEVGGLLPVCAYVFGLGEVEDDGHAVLVVLSDWPLVGGGGVGADGAVAVLGVLGGLEVGDGHEHLGQDGVVVLGCADAPRLDVEGLGLDEDLLPDDLVDLLRRRFGLRPRLVLVTVLDCRGLGEFEPLVGVVELAFVSAFLAVEVRRAFLRVLGGGGLCDLDLRGRVLLQRDPRPHARKHW